MACSVTITSVTGHRATAADPPNRLVVSGTATGCDSGEIIVTISPNVAGAPPATGTIHSDGTWEVTLQAGVDYPRGRIACGQTVKIDAACVDNSNCKTSNPPGPLACVEDSPPSCPTLLLEITGTGQCDANGKRSVTFRVTNQTPQVETAVMWNFGDGGSDTPANVLNQSTPTGTQTHAFAPTGSYTVSVSVLTPSGCSASATQIVVSNLAACPAPDCPQSVILKVLDAQGREVTVDPNQCLPPGRYTVRVDQPNDTGLVFSWSLNGTLQPTAQTRDFTFNLPADGTQNRIDVSVRKGSCPAVPAGVTLVGCRDQSCPTFGVATVQIGECDANRRRPVTITVAVPASGVGGATLQLDFGDGSPTASATVVGPNATATFGPHSYQPPGPFTAVLSVTDPKGCRGLQIPVGPLDTCERRPPPPPPPDDGGFDLCSILFFLALLGLCAAVLGLGLLLCPAFAMPVIPAQAALVIGGSLLAGGAAIGFIALIAWAIICRPSICAWLKLATAFFFIAGIVLTYFWACPACAFLAIPGLICLGISIVLFLVWLNRCRPSACSIFTDMLLISIVFDIVAFAQILLGWCVLTSNWVVALLYAAFVITFNTIAIIGQRNSCRIDPRG